MKIFKSIGLVLMVVLVLGCQPEYLDLTPNNVITDENFYASETDAINATNAVYSPAQGLYNGAAWQMLDIMSDNSDKGGGGANDGAEVYELDYFTLTSFNPMVYTYYSQCYQGIQRANIVLARVPGIAGMNEDIRNRCLGEAYFLRGWYYYMLVRVFGDVPLYTTPITLEESYRIGRSPVNAVYDTLLNDFTRAARLLPATRYFGDNAGRVNKWAALGMQASAYLTRGDKAKAAEKALEVIGSGVYRLNTHYGENFDVNKENGPESLFEIQYRNGGQQWNFFGQGNVINCFFGPRAQNIVQSSGYGFNVPTLEFMSKYERDNNGVIIDTMRRNVTVWAPGDKYGTYTQPSSLEGSPFGFNVRKYFVPITNTAADAGGWSCAINVPVLRYAEVLLIAAEALGSGAGNQYINQVRARAKLGPIQGGLSATDYLEAVYKERQIELAFECNRWFDLIRHPDANYMVRTMQATGRNAQLRHKLMPIPQIERDKNPNLSQNPGY